MKYNKSEIMKRAWEIYRAKDWRSREYVMVARPKLNPIFPGDVMFVEREVNTFSAALRCAWREAKEAMKEAKISANTEIKSQIDTLDTAIFNLQMKDKWSSADTEFYNELCDRKQRLVNNAA